jgi:ABC-type transporter Mla maintaining outer membrane lipid asymmetry ATPase subunit MlaF
MRPVHLRPSQALTTAYARAIALDPDLLMIEHPLEGQCPINIQPFLRSMQRRSHDPHKTLLVTTYKPRYFLDICDRFVMLHEGRMVFDGNGDEMLHGSNEWVRQYLSNSQDGPIQIF